MANDVHVRPAGLVYGRDAESLVLDGAAGRLAGGPVAFTGAFVRAGGAGKPWRWWGYRDLAMTTEPAVGDVLARIAAPRADFAGLAMDRWHVMGIVNVTPDSFSDGGVHGERETAIRGGLAMAGAGAAILDVGGESTRPGSDAVALEEELARIVPVIEALSAAGHLVSADTRKAVAMRAAAAAGARIVNDVAALTHDRDAAATVADLGLPVVLMHAQGDPKTMQENPTYADALTDVYDWLEDRVAAVEAAGVARDRIAVDPGIGFGKTFQHNTEIIAGLSLYHGLGLPVLFGASRKGFIGAITGEKVAGRRVAGSVGVAVHAAAQGAQMIRVHDVSETVHALKVWQASADGRLGSAVKT